MAKGITTTVTHPDGTISKRTSQSRSYTHAVVIAKTRDSMVADELATAKKFESLAEEAASASEGEVTQTERQWSGGRTYIELYLGGQFADAYVSDKTRPTDEVLRDRMRLRAAMQRESAQNHWDKAAELECGPEVTYGVLRWSTRADLAHGAASGEFARLVQPGVTISVVAVD